MTDQTWWSGDAGCDGAKYEIVYSVMDECGRTASCTQTFTIENDGPTIVCPADETISCISEIAEGIPTVTTSCGLMYDVIVAMPSISGTEVNCPGATYEILYSVIDECGRTASCTQTFTIENDGPTIVCPADEVVTCFADISVGVPTVSSSCDMPTTVTHEGPTLVSGGAGCDGAKYEIVYTVTDECGRTADCTQTFTLYNDGPTIVCPADETVTCFADIASSAPVVTTSCGLTYDLEISDPIPGDETTNCPGNTYEIVYTVTDECGRTAECVQTFTIENDGPTIVCPADATVSCSADITEGTPIVTSSCDLNTTVVATGPVLVLGSSDCSGAEYEMTYTVTDVCGRTASCVQTFTIENDGPTIVCPLDVTVECIDDITVGTPTTTTSCGLESTVTHVGPTLVTGQNNCDGSKYEIEYTVTDECGRTASCVQTFTLEQDPPTIVCPIDETVQCVDDINVGTPIVTVPCGLGSTQDYDGPNLVSGDAGCDGAKYEIVYSVTDECGRTASCTQTFTIENDGPTIVCPADETISCISEIAEGIPTVTTSCGLMYDVIVAMPSISGTEVNCPGATYEILYSVIDECGRTASCTQTFTIENDGPTIVCPADEVVTCFADINVGVPTVSSSCDMPTTVTHEGPTLVSGGAGCDGAKYEIVYTVTDECGRTADCTQTFTLDNDGPTIVCPADETVACFADIASSAPVVTTSCGLTYDVEISDPIPGDETTNCPGNTYEIVYTVTDECGRTAECVQTFTIENDGPTIVCPADATVSCSADITEGTPIVTSSCDLNTTVVATGPVLVSGSSDCSGAEYEMTYTVTDVCGRTASCVQTFTIENDGPTIVCPLDVTVECIDDITVGTPTTTTSCGLGSTVTHVGPTLVVGQNNCDGSKYEIEYTVTDECGRTASCVQTFTLEQDPPTIVCPIDETVQCVDDINVGTPIVTVPCGLGSTQDYDGPNLVSGDAGCDGAKYEIVYSVTDECGRTASCTQTFTIENDGPTIVCPADETISCISEIAEGIPTVTTSCGLMYDVVVAMPSISGTEVNCPGATYEILYSVIDECGRTASCTQTFTIENDGPTIVCPADEVVTCFADISVGVPTVSSSCDMPTTVTHEGPTLVSGGAGCDGAKYEIVYTVTDECGRTADCTQTFTLDNDGPTIVCPADETVACFADIASSAPVVTTSCGLTYDLEISDPIPGDETTNCPGNTYEIVYTVTDECGRTAECVQTFTIENDGPTIVCPADATVSCSADIVEGTPIVTSSCDLNTTVVATGPVLVSGSSDCSGAEYEMTYTVTDVCGRTASCVQTFTIENDGPTIVCPLDVTVECIDDVVAGVPTTTASCGLSSTVTNAGPVLVSGTEGCDGSMYEIEYTVTDECGRTASCVQTFTIEQDPPTIVCPIDETVQCIDDINLGTPIVTVPCGLGSTQTFDGPNLVSGVEGCDGSTYEYVYTVTDECGRSASCVQTFTIENDAPTITCPDDMTVECVGDIVAGTAIATASCEIPEVVVTNPTLVSGTEGCHNAIYEIGYSVTDACGRIASCVQTFTIENAGPTIVCPADQTISCVTDIAQGTPIVTTSCGLTYDVIVAMPDVSGTGADCPGNIYSISYTVIDECGREATCTQTFTIENDGPTITCPADETVTCLADIMEGTPVVTSSCNLMTTVTTAGPILVSGSDGCEGAVYQIIYTATDECGRSDECTQMFTLENDGPTIVCPADRTVECIDDIVEENPVVTSSCGLVTEVLVALPTIVGDDANCPGNQYQITYTAVDECGREASCTQTFTIENSGPTITCPADATVTCVADINQGTPIITSSCNLPTTLSVSGPTLVSGTADCDDAIYELVYTTTDLCGRTASCTQTFTIDNNGPEITCPADATVQCYEDIAAGIPSVVTNCGLTSSFTASDPILVAGMDNCPGAAYEITYVVTDDCGRTNECVQTFTIDNAGPTITCPADATVTCVDDITAGTPITTASCGSTQTVTTSGPVLVSGANNCPNAVYELIYTVEDECGRTASCTQTFTIDNNGPVITCPADETVECASNIVAGIPTIVTSCGVTSSFTTSGPTLVSGTADCDGAIYEIIYTAQDECGRTASCTQTFTIENDGPTIVCPADQIVECVDNITAGSPIVTSSCGIATTVTTSGPELISGTDNCYGAIYKLTYTVTDICGRTASCVQTFTIENDVPTIVCPIDATVQCVDDIMVGTPIVTTSCNMPSTQSVVGPTLVSGTDNCNGAVYQIVYSVTDACGRVASCTQTFTVENGGPTIICPADEFVTCSSDIVPGTPIVTSSCGLATVVTSTNPTLVNGTADCDGAIYEIVYTVTDECGRSSDCTQTFTISNNGPTIVCPADAVVQCEADIQEGIPTVTSSCGIATTITTSEPRLLTGTANCDGATYSLNYTVTDACGRTASCVQIFTIDNDGPTIVCPADEVITCAADIQVGTPSVSSSCGLTFNYTSNGPTLVSGTADCDGAVYEIVYTAQDECGRTSSCTQTFTVSNDGPTIVCPIDEMVECVGDIQEGTPIVTSSCGVATTVQTSGPVLVSGMDNCTDATYEITYTVTDACGRTASCVQSFLIVNDVPTITCPIDATVQCVDDIMVGTPIVTTSCGMPYTQSVVGPTLVSGTANCDGAQYEIVYTVEDACGRIASCTQTFTIDNSGPVVTCPADAIVACASDIQPGIPTSTSSCGTTTSFTTSGPTLIGGTANCDGATYELVYTVTDACGRTAQCTQLFTIDNEGPSITCPADATVTCSSDIQAGVPTTSSSCGVNTTYSVSGPVLVNGIADCDGSQYELTYVVTDACGRTSSCAQTFTIDNDGPTIVCPADQMVECVDDIIEGTPTMSSSCGVNITYAVSGPVLVSGTANCAGAEYELTYVATDACGRTSSCVQTFLIMNDVPTITCPNDVTVQCVDDIMVGTPIVTTSCNMPSTQTVVGPTLIAGTANCDGAQYEIVYTVEDACGRVASCTQTFTIDNDGPTIVCPANEIVMCVSDIVEGVPTVNSSCGVTTSVTTVGPTLVSGIANCDGAVYEMVYTATDICGRTASCTQTFTLNNNGPVITCPANEIVECSANIQIGTPTIIGACGVSTTYTTVGPILVSGTADCDGAVYEVTYTAEDVCGRTSSCTQTFTIDNNGPIITCPADANITCITDIAEGIPSVESVCGLDTEVFVALPSIPTIQANCPGNEYQILYSVIDVCGRTANCTQTFTIVNDGPIITCPCE